MRTLIADRGMGEPISLGAALLAGKKVAPDVRSLLADDHRVVLGWFDWYDEAPDPATRLGVARSLCTALRAHMAAEEQVFYPAAERLDGDLVQRALEQHDGAKRLIDRLERSKSADAAHAELVHALRAEIEAHVHEEETELFAAVAGSNMDFHSVGRGVATTRLDYLFDHPPPDRSAPVRSARARSTDAARDERRLKEVPPMPIATDQARDYFVAGVRNAHATVRQARGVVEAQIERLEQYPKLKQKLESHLMEKDAQLARLEGILERCGESRSAVDASAMTAIAGLAAIADAAAADEIIKNSFATLGLAKYEGAAFETLILFGEAAGEQEALRPLQQCLSEERAMAAFIEENLRATGMRFLQLESEGARASR